MHARAAFQRAELEVKSGWLMNRSIIHVILAILVTGCGAAFSNNLLDQPGVKTDYRVYREPPPPALPAAGGTFVDPVFGTTIMRVTDQNDGAFNSNQYSYYPCFNKNNTRLFITAGGQATLYSFDPDAFKISNKRRLFLSEPPGGHSPGAEDAIWSGVDPDAIYGHDGLKLWSYNVSSGTFKLIKDFGSLLPPCELWQMSRSIDDNVFAFTLKRGGKPTGYIAWRRNVDSLYKVDTTNLDEVQVDKTGQYLVVKQISSGGAGSIEARIINLVTHSVQDLTDGSPDYAPGHSDNGAGFVIGGDNWQNRFTYRSLATPHQCYSVIEFGQDWSIGSHVSMLADSDEWLLVSTFVANDLASDRLLRNELLMVATDGSKRVRRLAHTHSQYREYWDSPRATVSRDGRYAVFTSNWGRADRRDVFICKIPPVGSAGGSESRGPAPGVASATRVGARQNVVWADLARSAASGNSLQKVAGRDDAADAGARSQQVISSGDAWVEFTAAETNKTRYCGLARNSPGTDFASLDFAIKLTGSAAAEVRENGNYAAETTYRAGDLFRIAIESGKVNYYKNGSLFHTSLNAPGYPLVVKASLINLNARISDVIISTTPTR